MKATGIIRRIDELGRIVIPKEMRRELDINREDPVEISCEGEHIILRKYTPYCLFCGAEEDIRIFKDKKVCRACLAALKQL